MAMICVNGCQECDGCGACDDTDSILTRCDWCGEPVYYHESHYNFDGEIVHCECMREYVKDMFYVEM